MDALIKALIILRRYETPEYPTNCEHDVMYFDIEPNLVSDKDKQKLEILGIEYDKYNDRFYSHKFGSC